MKKVILVELNEINFSVLENYIDGGLKLENFKKLLQNGYKRTSSEAVYEQLEPWIQWVSVHTGLTYDQHRIFRLGDMVNSEAEQIFEKLEKTGVSVGAISPMNTRNCLDVPDFFIPDPWTYTPTDGKWYSKFLDASLKQAVNDNSQSKITKATYLKLFLALVRLLSIRQLIMLPKLLKSLRGLSYRKAILLDRLLALIFFNQIQRKKTDFATIFLNAGAHIQHHYFHNSKYVEREGCQNPDWYISASADPLAEVLLAYDEILGKLMSHKSHAIILATGLSQIPTEKLVFYYRLKNHEQFLQDLGLRGFKVKPRMTRDLLIEFTTEAEMNIAKQKLKSCLIGDTPIFQEIDERDSSLFVTLTYDNEINKEDMLHFDGGSVTIYDKVVFVALKNGEHCGVGYIASNSNDFLANFEDRSHVSKLNAHLFDFVAS